MKSRILILFSFLLGLWCIVIARGAFVQIIPNKRLAALKRRQFETSILINGRRGAILDRNGKVLAASVPAYSIFADPKLIHEPHRLARKLQRPLRMSYHQLLSKFKNRKRRFVWLRRQLSEQTMKKIKAWNEPGLGFIKEPKRVYPNGPMMAQVLGFVGSDGRGLEGLEYEYDKELRGKPERFVVPRDALGRPLLSGGRVLTDVPDGSDLVLTIDGELQFALERELGAALKEHDADSAVGIVMDPRTFQVLAMANLPGGDANDALHTPAEVRKDRTVTDAFEPGSTLKTFLMATALRDSVIKPSSRFFCEHGHFAIGGHVITEAESRENFDWLTAGQILAKSSNIGSSKIALALGQNRLAAGLKDFGFGQPTGIDLPGETKGIIDPLPWRPHHLCTVSFGQGISVSPIQLAAAYSAVADGGILKQPYIVKAIRSDGLHESKAFETKAIRRVLSEKDAATLRLMLTAATSDQGTGASARVPGYPVAGKTGTAQMVDLKHGGYLPHSYIASFAGFVPAQDPRFVIYIAIQNPRKGYYGAQAAAPVFAKVAQYALRRAGIAPTFITEKNVIAQKQSGSPSDLQKKALKELRKIAAAEKSKDMADFKNHIFPSLKGLSLKEAISQLRGEKLHLSIRGDGWLVESIPHAGEPFHPGQHVTLIFKNPE